MPRRQCGKRCVVLRFVKWQLGRVAFRSDGALALRTPFRAVESVADGGVLSAETGNRRDRMALAVA